MSTVVAERLVRDFGGKRAVDEVSFEVGEEEFLVLVGPSGCGKTTTLRLLAGLESLDTGRIRFGDRVVDQVRPRDRNVGMVFQDYAVFPHLTVFENIAYGLRSRRAARALVAERVPAAARTFRIEHLIGRKPRQLSGGERQRVALARAMVRDADLYLYDEPLSNLDAQLRHQAREDILTLHRSKARPSVYVTHDQAEATTMGDRIAVMRDGRLEQVGTPEELYRRPRSLFVAYFLGTPSINLFDAHLRADGDRLLVECPAFTLELPDEQRRAVEGHAGQATLEVKVGIRPEDLYVPNRATFDVDEGNTLHGVVNVIEPTAAGSSVYLSTTDEEPKDFAATFQVRVPVSYVGREIPMAVDTRRIQLFDSETERSLVHG